MSKLLMNPNRSSFPYILLAGDVLILAGITVIGQAMHDTLAHGIGHFLINFFSFAAGWFLAAPFLKVYDGETTRRTSELWRPLWAVLLGAPLGGFIRALMLSSAVMPLFIIVMGGILAVSLIVWRGIYLLFMKAHWVTGATNG